MGSQIEKNITTRPLSKEHWDDLLAAFGPQGACSGCWSTSDAYMGSDAVYRKLGFKEIARRRPPRPILRYEIA